MLQTSAVEALTSKVEELSSSSEDVSFFAIFDKVDAQSTGEIMKYDDLPLSHFLLSSTEKECGIMENLECTDLFHDIQYFSADECTMMSNDAVFDLIDYPYTPPPSLSPTSPTIPTTSFCFHTSADPTPSEVVQDSWQPPRTQVKQERQELRMQQSWYEHQQPPAGNGDYQAITGFEPMTSSKVELPQKPTNRSEVDHVPATYDRLYSSTHNLVSPSFDQIHHKSSSPTESQQFFSYPPSCTTNVKEASTTNIPIASPDTPPHALLTPSKSSIPQLPPLFTFSQSSNTLHTSPDTTHISRIIPNETPIAPLPPLTTLLKSRNEHCLSPDTTHISPNTLLEPYNTTHPSLFIPPQPPDTPIVSPDAPLTSPDTPLASPVTPMPSQVTPRSGKSPDRNLCHVHFIDIKNFYEKAQVRRGGISEQRLVNCRVHMMAVFVNPVKNIRVFVERYPENIVFEKYTEIPITREIMLPNTQYFSCNLDAVYLTRFGNKFYQLSTTDRQRKNRFRLRVTLTFEDKSIAEYKSDPFLIRSRKQSPNPRKKRGKSI